MPAGKELMLTDVATSKSCNCYGLKTEPCNAQSVIRNTTSIQYWSICLIYLFLLHFQRSD